MNTSMWHGRWFFNCNHDCVWITPVGWLDRPFEWLVLMGFNRWKNVMCKLYSSQWRSEFELLCLYSSVMLNVVCVTESESWSGDNWFFFLPAWSTKILPVNDMIIKQWKTSLKKNQENLIKFDLKHICLKKTPDTCLNMFLWNLANQNRPIWPNLRGKKRDSSS